MLLAYVVFGLVADVGKLLRLKEEQIVMLSGQRKYFHPGFKVSRLMLQLSHEFQGGLLRVVSCSNACFTGNKWNGRYIG